MSFLDDMKDLLHIHGAQLNERMVGIEDSLTRVRGVLDREARRADYQTFTFFKDILSAEAGYPATATELLTVPDGSYYELVQWAFASFSTVTGEPANELPALAIDLPGQVVDIALGNGAASRNAKTSTIIIPEKRKLLANAAFGNTRVRLFLQFKVYTIQPTFVDAGELD